MKPLIFLMTKTVKNYLKELVKKPLILVLYVIIAASFIMTAIFSIISPGIRTGRGSQEVYGAIVTGALAVFVYFSVKQGIGKGNSFFRLADVNLAFTAPISPKKILLYGFIKQFFSTFLVVLFLSFQIPNLKMNFPINGYGVSIIYISVFLLFFSMQLIGMLIYSISSKSYKIRNGFEKGLNISIMVLAAGFLWFILKTKDVAKAGILLLNNDYINYIPFLGWFKVILNGAVKGIDSLFVIDCVLVLAAIGAAIIAVYMLKTDYYEDVLAATERKEELLRIKKSGKGNASLANLKVRKVNYSYKGSGAAAIFHRQLLEYKKGGFFFINRSSLIIIAVGIASKYFFPHATMKTVLFFTIYMLFFFSIQGKWSQELGKPFIFLIPSGSAAKVFYATLADIIKYSVDGLLLFGAAGLMFKADLWTILLCGVAYATYGAIYTYGDVLFQRLLGEVHSKNLSLFLKMFLILFVIAPGLVGSIVAGFVFGGTGISQYYSYFILIIYNILVSLIMLAVSKGVFEHLEIN